MNALFRPAVAIPPPTPDSFPIGCDNSQAFFDAVRAHTSKSIEEWYAMEHEVPNWGPVVSPREQHFHEQEADHRIEETRRLLLRYPKLASRRGRWRENLLQAARQTARSCLGVAEASVDLLFTEPALEATRQFIRQAKGFDQKISEQDLFQALRNLWVIHSLQLLMNHPLSLSPATFAYSMLYPWTDNYLDDPGVTASAKADFGRWLEGRLAGNDGALAGRRADQIGRLIGLIESYFPRETYPEVYLSLRAIHRAQMGSLWQQGPDPPTDEQQLLRITVAKGGTSVLADAYLICGQLPPQEADFIFGYGVLLQLMDDLQDMPEDLANRHTTILTRRAAVGPLDDVVSKLWCFVTNRLRCPNPVAIAHDEPLKSLIRENCRLMLFQAVAHNPRFYTEEFIAMVESHATFSFKFLRERAKSLTAERVQLINTLSRTHHISSVFELLD